MEKAPAVSKENARVFCPKVQAQLDMVSRLHLLMPRRVDAQ